jgi:type IV pilus assembly protein PilV
VDARLAAAHRTARGFTLVEVLVALFVVALGVAGAAAVQTLAVRAAGEAARLSDGCSWLASLAQRMRANPAAMALPDAPIPISSSTYAPGGAPAAPHPAMAAPIAAPRSWRSFDLFEPPPRLASRFPGGRMRVCRRPANRAAGLVLRGPPARRSSSSWAGAAKPGAAGRAVAVFLALGPGGAMSRALRRARPA